MMRWKLAAKELYSMFRHCRMTRDPPLMDAAVRRWHSVLHFVMNSLSLSLSLPLSPSLRFNGHFPAEPRLAGVYRSKGWWRWWWQLDYWSYKSCKAPVKSSPPTNQHPVFLQARCPSCRPTNSVKALNGNILLWTVLEIRVMLSALQALVTCVTVLNVKYVSSCPMRAPGL